MSNAPRHAPAAPRPNTAAGFLLAPGIASLAGALVVAGALLLDPTIGLPVKLGSVLGITIFMSIAFAVVGYATAAVVGVPIYLTLPERARSCFAVVVPLAGAIAAAPWFALVQPWRDRASDGVLLWIPFSLGCLGGIAFLFIRRPRPRGGAPEWPNASPPASAALSCGP